MNKLKLKKFKPAMKLVFPVTVFTVLPSNCTIVKELFNTENKLVKTFPKVL